jgi:CHAT domain-containing protein/Tfp pilus assembly protein PilF
MWRLHVFLVVSILTAAACIDRSAGRADQALRAAEAALRAGALATALAEVGQAEALSRSSPASLLAHSARLAHGEILLAKPDLKQAGPLIDAPVPDSPPFRALRARQMYLQARVAVLESRLNDALAAVDRALSITQPDDAEFLDAELLGGQIRLRLGLFEEAETRLRRIAADTERVGDRYRHVIALNTMGMGLLIRNRLDEALTWFERALSFADQEHTAVYSVAMFNAGACYARLGQFDRAVAIQKRAVARNEGSGAAGPYEVALGELGSTYLLQNDVTRAVPYLEKAIAVARDAGLDGDAALWAKNLAAGYIYAGKWDEAERLNEEARRLTPPERRHKLVFNTLHSARIAAGRNRNEEAKQLFEAALAAAGAEPNVQWGAHEGLARLATAAGDRLTARREFERALAVIERTRADLLKTDYKLSFLSQLIGFYQEYVELLVRDGAVERALEIADSSRGRVLAERHGTSAPPTANVAALRRLAAASGTRLVSYWLAPHRSYVWVLDGRGVRLHELPSADDIARLVQEHRAAIANALADPLKSGATAGDRLYTLLVAPVVEGLPRDGSLTIVADGALHGLNFETLPVDAPRRYLIEDVQVQIAPSLALLAANRQPHTAARSLLLIGNPTPRDPEFPTLRFATAEMTNIASHFDGARVRTVAGSEASPETYRRSAPEQFALVHFTSHAEANIESPLDSAVILSGADSTFKLYARDVAAVPLQADLVTVSACRGAGERAYSGEGLVGFAWAFLRAGARRVIAGLWDVDDRSTAELMSILYGRIAAGDSPARALRHAKLMLLRNGGATSRPYYWGPFQIFTMSP